MDADGNAPLRSTEWLAPHSPREGLRYYAEIVRGRAKLILACVLAAALVAVVYTHVVAKSYEATATLLVTPVNAADPDLLGLGLIPSSSDPTRDVSTAASIVTTPDVAARAAQALGGATSPHGLLGFVRAEPLAQSNVVAITAKAGSATKARDIANAFAQATIADRTARLRQQLDAMIPPLSARVATLPSSERTGQGSLGDRLVTLESLRAGSDPTVHVETLAQTPGSPSWPRPKLSVAIGIVVGLVIGVGAAFTLEALDPRVAREETLRQLFRLPLLARIPLERGRARHSSPLTPGELSPGLYEGFRMLRVSLDARGGEAPSRSVLVTSSGRSEGKSTTALNLAAALSSAGHHVILIEADLRRPSLRAALRVRPEHGVASVLLRVASLDDALTRIGTRDGSLRALLAEESAPQLAESPLAAHIVDLVEEAKQMAEFVIVDAPPVTEVSDALPLTQHVDDVLIVARIGRSRVDRLQDLGELLARQGVRPVGLVVIGGERSRAGKGYYEEPPVGRGRGILRRRLPVATGNG